VRLTTQCMIKLPEVGMEEFRIEPDDDGVEVIKARPDGKVCFVGRFPTEERAKLWIETRTLSAPQPQASAPRN
jgi:hypothetical protein